MRRDYRRESYREFEERQRDLDARRDAQLKRDMKAQAEKAAAEAAKAGEKKIEQD